MLDGLWQCPGSSRCILKNGQIIGLCIDGVVSWIISHNLPEAVVRVHNFQLREIRRKRFDVFLSDEHHRAAIVNAQCQCIGPKQRKHGDRNGATLDGAKHGRVKGNTRFEHNGNTIPFTDALAHKPMGNLRRRHCDFSKGIVLAVAISEHDADGLSTVDMPVNTLMRQIQIRLAPIKELP